MLTVDDCNTIMEKYNCGYFYDVDVSELPVGETINKDFFSILLMEDTGDGYGIRLFTDNSAIKGLYLTTFDGEPLTDAQLSRTASYFQIRYFPSTEVICRVFVNLYMPPISEYDLNYPTFVPVSSLTIPVIKGEFDDKLYIQKIRTVSSIDVVYTIDGVDVELGTDERGTYFTLPSANTCLIGSYFIDGLSRKYRFLPFKVTFGKGKELPIPYIPTLYKGTPQNVQVLNSEDDDPISDYQTYYQGRLLKDNIIHLPYDADDYINIIVDLKDYRYPFCTVKLKAPTVIYQANSQGDVETAIENGIQTLQVGDNETEVILNAIELSNVTLINSNIQVSESILTNCQIIDSAYTDNGGNTVTDTIFKDTDYSNTAQSNNNNLTFQECTIHDSEINLTGTITECTITDTLILSDGVITITNNTFTGVGMKDYFPSHLYLTGDYTVTGNTFTLEGEWTELEYNMCIIKAINDFNPSQFINNNTLHLNITYQDEPVNTFYYNIVDEDKIRAVRLN